MTESCRNCKFSKDPWKRKTAIMGDIIWCRRFPPFNVEGSKRYPVVKETDWCGEWKTDNKVVPLPDRS